MSIENFRKSIQDTRELLNEIYDTTRIIDFRELVTQYASMIPTELHILFYIKERKWFRENRITSDDFLRFNFLSFEIINNKPKFFNSAEALRGRESDLVSQGYRPSLSSKCAIILNEHELQGYDLEPLSNLTRRLFVSFYKNCGSFDHFRESVALRFARELHRSREEINEGSLIKFIQDELDLQAHILHQKDEIYFQDGTPFNELVTDATTGLPSTVTDDESFVRAFKTSVLRKNKTYGVTGDGVYRFAIVTHVEEYFVYNETLKHRTIKQKPKFCIVFIRRGDLLDIEEVFHASRIISSYFNYSEIHDREELMSFYGRKALEIEETLSEDPAPDKSEIEGVSLAASQEILEFVQRISGADGYSVYFYDPIDQQLFARLGTRLDRSLESLQIASDLPHSDVFRSCKAMDIWHPAKLTHDIAEAQAQGNTEKAVISERWLKQSQSLAMVGIGAERAAWVSPIIKGRTPVGIVEFYAVASSRLSPSIPVFHSAVGLIGELMHRIELANDRGWLTQLSYIQVARHRIENIIDKVHSIDPSLSQKIRSSFVEASDLPNSDIDIPYSHDDNIISRILGYLVDRGVLISEQEELVEKLSVIQNIQPLSSVFTRAITDVLETLLSNSMHSPFRFSDLEIHLFGSETDFPYIEVRYLPEDEFISLDKARRLCASPIRRTGSPTYHFGLFLCGTQLRMIGGNAVAKAIDMTGLNSSQFGLVFQIPVRSRRLPDGGST